MVWRAKNIVVIHIYTVGMIPLPKGVSLQYILLYYVVLEEIEKNTDNDAVTTTCRIYQHTSQVGTTIDLILL